MPNKHASLRTHAMVYAEQYVEEERVGRTGEEASKGGGIQANLGTHPTSNEPMLRKGENV